MIDWKKAIRNILFWFLGAVISLLFISALFFLYIQTTPGKRFLASTIEFLFSAKIEGNIRIKGIEGFVPFNISVKQIALLDSKGTWLVIDNASLRWSPPALIHGRIVTNHVSSSSIHIYRLPEDNQPEKERNLTLPSVPAKFPQLTIQRFSMASCHLDSAVVGQEATFSINGRMQPPQNNAYVEGLLDLLRIDGSTSSLSCLSR